MVAPMLSLISMGIFVLVIGFQQYRIYMLTMKLEEQREATKTMWNMFGTNKKYKEDDYEIKERQ
jgi:hypothetical protein